ncbi:MAG: hypothetical protein JRI51_06915 [Deltaproteobacteria bacterium]|nr:hypothetical protein [Deltaproteobacteria bacterium]
MKIGIPVWDGKVSPVFDSASRLMVVDVQGRQQKKLVETSIRDSDLSRRCNRLKGLGVELLICGAISSQLRNMLMALGIKVIPWISGQAEDVVRAYMDGSLCDRRFVMPGCGEEQLAEMTRVYYRERSKEL